MGHLQNSSNEINLNDEGIIVVAIKGHQTRQDVKNLRVLLEKNVSELRSQKHKIQRVRLFR